MAKGEPSVRGTTGRRTDSAVETKSDVATMISYLKGLLDILGERDTGAATGTVTTTDDVISYVKQLVTNSEAIKTQVDKLAGATPTVGSVSANWNTAAGTSGEPGEDLCTIGADGVLNKILSLVIAIDAATAGAVITVKMFQQVDGVERKVYSEGFVKGTDPDGLWIIAGVVGIHEALRVEVFSDTNEAVEFDFDYMLEVM